MREPTIRVDVIRHGRTRGQTRSDEVLVGLIGSAAGFRVVEIHPKLDRLPDVLRRRPLDDLADAFAIRQRIRQVVRSDGLADVYLLPTITSVLLLPTDVLRRSAVRFDSLAAENRPGLRSAVVRLLERRALRRIPLMLPYTLLPSRSVPRRRLVARQKAVGLPTPIATEERSLKARDPHLAVAYCGDPRKKGLDLLMRSWGRADLPADARLVVAGIDAEAARRYLHDAGVIPAGRVQFVGTIPHDEFIDLLQTAGVYVGAARYEDFGIAPLEAMHHGALICTTRSQGAFEARRLVEEVNPAAVVDVGDHVALASAIRRLITVVEPAGTRLRAEYREAVAPYLEEAVAKRIREELLPALQAVARESGSTGEVAGSERPRS